MAINLELYPECGSKAHMCRSMNRIGPVCILESEAQKGEHVSSES